MVTNASINEFGVTYYDTTHLEIPEYCALNNYPQYGKDSLSVCLDGHFSLLDLKKLVAFMEVISADH
jgi:hypothetical protein